MVLILTTFAINSHLFANLRTKNPEMSFYVVDTGLDKTFSKNLYFTLFVPICCLLNNILKKIYEKFLFLVCINSVKTIDLHWCNDSKKIVKSLHISRHFDLPITLKVFGLSICVLSTYL